MKQLFGVGKDPSLHEALMVRIQEADALLVRIEASVRITYNDINREINRGTNELNWADLGSLAHAVEMLEEAARALGLEVEE